MPSFLSVAGLRLPAYGVFFALGCTVSVLLGFLRCRRLRLDTNDALIVAACSLGCGLILAKLLFLLVSVPFGELWRLLALGRRDALLSGGQVYIGGFIGGVPGALLGAKIAGCRLDGYARAFVPALPLGQALGRVGCLFAGCCYGKPYAGFGAVTYFHAAGGAPDGTALFPVQAAEALFDLGIFFALLRFSKNGSGGRTLALYGLLYCPARFALEFLRFDAVRGGFCGLSTSQWLCAAVFALCAAYFTKNEIA